MKIFQYLYFDCLFWIDINVLFLSFVVIQWIDMILENYLYIDVDYFFFFKEKLIQINIKSFEENGVKCNIFYVFMLYDNIVIDFKFLLYQIVINFVLNISVNNEIK